MVEVQISKQIILLLQIKLNQKDKVNLNKNDTNKSNTSTPKTPKTTNPTQASKPSKPSSTGKVTSGSSGIGNAKAPAGS